MIKILYAAGENENSRIQLSRFLKAVSEKNYSIKVAAYKNSSPTNTSIDWTLDCLKNIYQPNLFFKDNDNFVTYFEQVKYYNPDLIISDLDYYTSYIANVLNKPIWQCSASLISLATTFYSRYNTGIKAQYLHQIHDPYQKDRSEYMLHNSDCNFVYSHFGDVDGGPQLEPEYKWIRPYHIVGKDSAPCSHNVVAGLLKNNKKIFHLLQKYPDSVVFSNFMDEYYSNVKLKDINNFEEYTCNLKNSKLFICEGHTSFLADAFYNNKYSISMINFNDSECVVNSLFSKKYQLSHIIYDAKEDLSPYLNLGIQSNYNNNIKYLHEKIDEFAA